MKTIKVGPKVFAAVGILACHDLPTHWHIVKVAKNFIESSERT